MKIAVVDHSTNPLHLKINGRITHQDVSPLDDRLSSLVGPEVFQKTVLVDLSNADYLDSSGVGWLLSCHKRFRTNGGRIVLHSLQPMVANVLRLLKLDALFDVSRDQHEALAKVTSNSETNV